MTNIKTIIETIEQKERMYTQHTEALKQNLIELCNFFKGKFSFSFESDVFYETDFRSDMNYTYCLRTSKVSGFEVVKKYDDGDVSIIPIGDLPMKHIRLLVNEEVIQKLLNIYLSEIMRIELLYNSASSQSQNLKNEICSDVVCEKL